MQIVYRNRLLILIILFFIGGAVIGGFVDIKKLYYGFDKNRYEEACRLFEKNEKEALDILNNINMTETQYSVNELKNGIYLWAENINILDEIYRIEDIPNGIKQRSRKLKSYCKLRIKYFNILRIRLEKGVPSFKDAELTSLETRIKKIIIDNELDSNNS